MHSVRMAVAVASVAALALAGPARAQDVAAAVEPVPEYVTTISARTTADSQTAIKGINTFSLDLYRQSAEPGTSLFISPASVSVAVGLAYRGAQSTTAAELEKVMHFALPPAEYLRANGEVLATMNFAGPRRELRTANSLWLQTGMPLRPEYQADIVRYARAGLQRVDYRKNPDAARLEINRWVAEATRDKIRDLLGKPDVTELTRAVLVNSIYWKGSWWEPFNPAATRNEPFTLLGGEKTPVPLMHQQSQFRVLERGGVKAILLPYAGFEVDMAVFLPNSANNLPQFEAKLTDRELTRWLADLDKSEGRDTILSLPKMHLEWRGDFAETLKTMGAPISFSDDADFSGVAPMPYPGEREDAIGLKIKHVIHKTFLDVDELGSEAAAATAVTMDVIITGRRISSPPPPPFIFRADKPFLFLLRDARTGLILFIGRYLGPGTGG